ncbi:DNA uptake protein [Ichthyobacterium seriolicida]|uniref:DNA uptake protein n=1 Tax=Ichthyobacterium seriolicida TaxID=242600 RepID=A0A1J1E4U7_9FLAO|nr:DNA uptake protein [Ichthyobacterium seriolicida]
MFEDDIYSFIFTQKNLSQLLEYEKDMIYVEKKDELVKKKKSKFSKRRTKKNLREIRYREFNPNTINKKEWIELGFSNRQADAILKYKNTVKEFKSKEDLKKIFVISKDKYKKLKPYIKIERTPYTEKKKNINLANANDLKEIKGIGNVLSLRIIKFRDKLGGFANRDVLSRVYGLKDSVIELIEKKFTFDFEQIEKININKASLEQLNKLPILRFEQSKAIIQFRAEYREFQNVEELSKLEEFSTKDIKALKFYIST